MNGARTLLSTTIKKYWREQLASFSRLAYPCNQANEKKKKKKSTLDGLIEYNRWFDGVH